MKIIKQILDEFTKMRKINPKNKPFGDRDRDGVINILDCQPNNFRRQDVVLYHGTTSRAAQKIKKEGLRVGHGINPVLYLTPKKEIARRYSGDGVVFRVKLSDEFALKHNIPIKTPNIPHQVTISEDISKQKIKQIKS